MPRRRTNGLPREDALFVGQDASESEDQAEVFIVRAVDLLMFKFDWELR
jgi:hypothetical protein